ncbi:hypothetical protein LJC56_05860 [Christensenellaceae bacterium OttesenSCG-928-K19]|nr:hypothetical protein [Christensenellaceae bacterium OttesenSCG-928-K19]
MTRNEDFVIDPDFQPIAGYGILDTVKGRLQSLAAEHVSQNAGQIDYVIQTISGEADYKREKDLSIIHIIGMRRDGVDYSDKEARVDDIDIESISKYTAFYRLDMIFRSEDGICNPDWYYSLSKASYAPENYYPENDSVVCK